ncbi:MAG: esterase-like activity of phytase family protein [Bacteroidota bacterium]
MTHVYPKCLMLFVCFLLAYTSTAQELTLEYLSTYHTGIFDEGAAEIAAYDKDGQRLFFVNANDATVDVLDISDPSNPQLINSLDCTPYGAVANSVAIHSGVVAVAIEDDNKQANGRVVFFDTNGNYLNDVEAGALPDMLTFTPDGMKVVVANEGEPDDDYVVDPEGSITIVDLSSGVAAATTTQISLADFNDKKMSLINRGIRIFGNDGQQTVAQDLEPEYIALSDDGSIAYVACQENNALAVVDVDGGTVVDILPLGYKDHMKGEIELDEYLLNEIPWWNVFDLGTPAYGGETVQLGGFSGLCYDASNSTPNQMSFWAVPDRGPNESTVSAADAGSATNLRPFKLPNYQARLVKLNYIKSLDMFFPDANQIFLKRQDGTPISGRGNIPGFDETPVTRTDANVFTNVDYSVDGVDYHALDFDAFGGDFEGVIRTPDFHFWLCDEYRPAIYHFDENGTLIDRFVPAGTSMLGTTPQPVGYYGNETLPAVYAKRRANRGFEAIAYDYDEDVIYAFIQSPIENPDRATVRNNSDVIRIIGISRATGQPVKEFVYLLERNRDAGVGLSRVDKIGDAVYAGNGVFFILERDSSTPNDGNTGKKYVYEIRTEGATNILGTALSTKTTSAGPDDKTLEMMTADDLAAAGVRPVYKTKVVNLPSVDYLPSDKPEGLALLPNGDLVVLNDNDFGLAGAGVSDQSSMGFLKFQRNYGFDASNRSDEIEIMPHPTLGIFQPDAIASYSVNGKQYIVTANEGDARDYDGYSEEERVNDLVLDPAVFTDAASMQEDEKLGRLNTTLANGDIDQDGMHELIYSYGARSFSIWDENGNLIYDSGNEFETYLASVLPDHFNSTNDDNDSFKNRSDDKGPEPEAVTIARWNGETYALIGLERIGGVITYNISDPFNPYLVDYVNNRDFSADAETPEAGDLGVEDIVFIDAADSPTNEPLVVTANEVSGTVSIFSVGDGNRPAEGNTNPRFVNNDIYLEGVFPNPFSDKFNIAYHLEQEGKITINLFNSLGQKTNTLLDAEKTKGLHRLEVDFSENMSRGNYWIVIQQNGKTIKTHSIVKQ